MARAAKSKPASNSDNEEKARLIAALKFASVAIEKTDNSGLSEFITIAGHWLMARNETFALGVQVDTDLEISLHAEKFLAALELCGDNFNLVQFSANELSIQSGNFRAVVPTLPPTSVAEFSSPDAPAGQLSAEILEAFRVCGKACAGKGSKVYHNSVLLQANTMQATNGAIAFEFWHGSPFPCPMGIPKKTVDALAKLGEPIAGFGFSDRSLTIYLSNGSFIKTRLMTEAWPTKLSELFDKHAGPHLRNQPLWAGFVDALGALAKFTKENDTIVFHDNLVATSEVADHAAASYVVPGLPGGPKYSLAYWRIVAPFAVNIVLPKLKEEPLGFFCNNVRGLILGKH